MMLPILQAPDDRLRQVAEPLPARAYDYNINHKEAIQNLRATFEGTPNCIGLAANQLGLPWRVIVVDVSRQRSDIYLMVNPVITKASEDQQAVRDGCMSIRNGKWFAQTRRPKRLTVEWIDPEDGEPRRQKFAGLIAAVIHHEIDHLNGVLFTDSLAAKPGEAP